MKRTTSNINPVLIRAKYRSKLEEQVAKQLEDAGIEFTYETLKIPYTVPAREAKYVADFTVVKANGATVVLEAKGRFGHKGRKDAEERKKFLYLKDQYPDLDLRFIFNSAHRTKIYPGSPTTVAQWAETLGFPYADKGIVPQTWLNELKTKSRS